MTKENDSGSLTSFSEGSILEIFTLSFPLMISSLAALLMLFVVLPVLEYLSREKSV